MAYLSIVKPVENPRGIGEVFDKGRLVARVSYNLDVLQEEILHRSPDTSEAAENSESAIGNITIIEKGKKLKGTNILTLHLKDNRKLDFLWQKTHPLQPKYSVRSSGIFY